jgi:hypothetical protein
MSLLWQVVRKGSWLVFMDKSDFEVFCGVYTQERPGIRLQRGGKIVFT